MTLSATTALGYEEAGGNHSVTINPTAGSFAGQVTQRSWNVVFMNAGPPAAVTLDAVSVPAGSWTYESGSRRLTVRIAQRPVSQKTVVAFR